MFARINTKSDNRLSWDEYVSYTLQKLRDKELMHIVSSGQPFPENLQVVKSMKKYQKIMDTIVRIVHYPVSQRLTGGLYHPLKEKSNQGEKYITVSRCGMVNFWSLSLEHLKTHKIKHPRSVTQKALWVTDFCFLPNLNMLAVASTTGSITFYDVTAYRFDKVLTLTKLDVCPLCIHYWVDPSTPTRSKLFWGDPRGNICALVFEGCEKICFFKQKVSACQPPKFEEFPLLLGERVCGVKGYMFREVHSDKVLNVKYYDKLNESILSCCSGSNDSLHMGDIQQNKSIYFTCPYGVQTFAYNHSHNLILTGGRDRIIRIWNPFLSSEPIMKIRGPNNPIDFIFVHERYDYMITVTNRKEIQVFDMDGQKCLQDIMRRQTGDLGSLPVSAAFFNKDKQALILGTTKLAILKKPEQTVYNKQLVSQNLAVSHILYNSFFCQIVSASVDSFIVVWSAESGERVIQFLAHSIRDVMNLNIVVEITAMSFDSTQRRLITAARDATIKIWNHNSGSLLKTIRVYDTNEIVGIVVRGNRILTAGWNKKITDYYEDKKSGTSHTNIIKDHSWKCCHTADITCMASSPPDTLATASSDGDIVLWNCKLKRPFNRFNAHKSQKSIVKSFIFLEEVDEREADVAIKLYKNHLSDIDFNALNKYSAKKYKETTEFISYNTKRPSIASEVPHLERRQSQLKSGVRQITVLPPKLVPSLDSLTSSSSANSLMSSTFSPIFEENTNESNIKGQSYNQFITPIAKNEFWETKSGSSGDNILQNKRSLEVSLNNSSNNNTAGTHCNPHLNEFLEETKINSQQLLSIENLEQDETIFEVNQLPLFFKGKTNCNSNNHNNYSMKSPQGIGSKPQANDMLCGSDKNIEEASQGNNNQNNNIVNVSPANEYNRDKYDNYLKLNQASVLKLISLDKRASDRNTATLVSLSHGGWIRFWSIECSGGLIGQFNGGHHPGNSVHSMCLDLENEYLFTGDTEGYIKTWDIEHYCVNKDTAKPYQIWHKTLKYKNFPLYRNQDSVRKHIFKQSQHRPPPSCTNPKETWVAPDLINSFRGHVLEITDMVYIDSLERLITSSTDCSIRVWSLYGQFLGIFGQETPWSYMKRTIDIWGVTRDISYEKRTALKRHIPRDIRRVASPTTLRVLSNGVQYNWRMARCGVLVCLYIMRKIREKRLKYGYKVEEPAQSMETLEVRTVHYDDLDLELVKKDLEYYKNLGSKVFGKAYRKARSHKPIPELPKPKTFNNKKVIFLKFIITFMI